MNIKIDPTKLLGFKLVAADLAAAGTVAGAKIGNRARSTRRPAARLAQSPGLSPGGLGLLAPYRRSCPRMGTSSSRAAVSKAVAWRPCGCPYADCVRFRRACGSGMGRLEHSCFGSRPGTCAKPELDHA